MNRPNDLLRNLLLMPLCFLVVLGIFILMQTTYVSPNYEHGWYVLMGVVLVVGMLIAIFHGIRLLAICAVTIYYLIRYPLWRSKNKKWALFAVTRVRSESKLAEIAQNSILTVAMAAVERLQDADLLSKIATTNLCHESVKETACKKIGHDWDYCKCRRCGKRRDEQHDWTGCKCRQCGKLRHNFNHDKVYSLCNAQLVTETEQIVTYECDGPCYLGSGWGCSSNPSSCGNDSCRKVKIVETTYIVFSDGTKQRWGDFNV